MHTLFRCGPVSIQLNSAAPEWRERAAQVLGLYDHRNGQQPPIRVHIHCAAHDAVLGKGSFLRCAGLHVDKTPDGLYASCRSGAYAYLDSSLQSWDIFMPQRFMGREVTLADEDDNLEDLLELVLTTAWRQADWIPLHAGAVVRDSTCALVTAPSRGGKTTATVAMLHRGWKTLGDDKLLVKRSADGRSELYALQSIFNIDPQTNHWFSEIGDLSKLPLDSAWTPKRRLPIQHIWQDRMVAQAQPTHLIQIERSADSRPAHAGELSSGEVLSALLHQTVVPQDRETARQVVTTVSALARQVRGLRLELGQGAYEDKRTLDLMERMLE